MRIRVIAISRFCVSRSAVRDFAYSHIRDVVYRGSRFAISRIRVSAIEQWFRFYNEERPHSANSFGVLYQIRNNLWCIIS